MKISRGTEELELSSEISGKAVKKLSEILQYA